MNNYITLFYFTLFSLYAFSDFSETDTCSISNNDHCNDALKWLKAKNHTYPKTQSTIPVIHDLMPSETVYIRTVRTLVSLSILPGQFGQKWRANLTQLNPIFYPEGQLDLTQPNFRP